MACFAVTGATGHLGRTVLGHLRLWSPQGTRLVGCTRDPDCARGLEDCTDELRRGDFADPASLLKAFEGVDTLLLISIEGDDELRIRLQAQAVEAARSAGVGRIVYTSFFDVDPASPSVVARVHRLTEEAVQASGCDWTLLRNGPYVDNVALRVAAAARAGGVFRMAAGEARLPFIARADLAQAAARAVVAGEAASHQAYRLSGAELLSFQDLSNLVGNALDLPVRYEDLSAEAYREELALEGLSTALQARRWAYARSMREGYLSALTDDFARLVGHAPRRMSSVVPTLDLSPGQPLH